MYRDRVRDYGHREHCGGRHRVGERDRDREHGRRDRECHGNRDGERYPSRRDDRRRDHGGSGGIGVGGGRGEREFEEHRRDDDRRREFKRDDERGHRRGREDGSPARRGNRGRKEAGTPEGRSLEGCVTLSQRRRKASGWDVHALGYEYSAMQMKQTGRYHWFLVSWNLPNYLL